MNRPLLAVRVAVLAAAAAAMGAFGGPGSYGALEGLVYDRLLEDAYGQLEPSGAVALVVVDDRTLVERGLSWPPSRAIWGELIASIAAAQPKVIAVDALFDRPSPPISQRVAEAVDAELGAAGVPPEIAGDASDAILKTFDEERRGDRRFSRALAEAGNVVLGTHLVLSGTGAGGEPVSPELGPEGESLHVQARAELSSLAPLQLSALSSGAMNVLVDADGIVRRYPLLHGLGGQRRPSLALEAARQAKLAVDPDRLAALDHGSPLLRLVGPGELVQLSASDLLRGSEAARGLLKDKIVLIGVSATGGYDRLLGPRRRELPAVYIHAAALEGLHSGNFLRSGGTARGVAALWTLLLLGGLLLLSGRRRSLWISGVGALVAALLHFIAAIFVAQALGWVWGVLPVLGALAIGFPLDALVRFLAERARRVELEIERRTRKEVEEMKDRFVAVVSHELRTPVTSIRGSLGLLLGGAMGPVADEQRELLQVAQRNTERLESLVGEILDQAKLAAGELELTTRPIVLAALVSEALTALEGFASQHDVRLVLREPLPELSVQADPDRITQVITNLVSNAVKYSPEGGDVELRCEVTERGWGRVSIADHGPGIPAEFRPHIFERFSQARGPRSSRRKGTGLGLNISRQLVEAHGGHIDFETEIALGSTFYFELPPIQPASQSG